MEWWNGTQEPRAGLLEAVAAQGAVHVRNSAGSVVEISGTNVTSSTTPMDTADQVRRHRDAVKLLQVSANLSYRHAARIERQDAVVEAVEAALTLGHDHRLEAAVAITRHRQRHLAVLGQHRLVRMAVAAVARATARRIGDILIAVVDGLTGFPDAITTVFPQTAVQTCIVHLIRNSLAFVSWKDRKKVMPDLRAIYRAETAEAAAARLDEFEACWGERYPAIVPAWRRAWENVVPMFAFPPQIRKMIYTTNALESLHRSLRKIIKTRGSFPSDEAATKLLFLAIRNAGVHWRRPIEWTAAMGQFAILFEDRFPASAR